MSFGSGTFGSGGAGALAPPPFIPPQPPVVVSPWPATLPQIPLRDGFVETEPNLVRRTPMDEGPAKQRLQYTTGIRPFVLQVELDVDQVATFDTFYSDTLRDGTLPFAWKHPRSQVNTTFRFAMEPQKIKGAKARNYRVLMALEVML